MCSHEAIFEAPLSHEASEEAAWEADPTTSFEWDSRESEHEGYPELTPGYETGYETSYEGPDEEGYETGYEASDESGAAYEATLEEEWSPEGDPFLGDVIGAITGALGLGELGVGEVGYETSYEDEWSPEAVNGEADQFFKAARKLLRQALPAIAPVAAQLAPVAMNVLRQLTPAGPGLGPLAALLREAEPEAQQLEAQLLGSGAATPEVAITDASQEAALAEVLAAEAVVAETDAEAVARIAATLPIVITITRGRRALRPVLPALTQANARLVRVLRRRGPAGRQLLRALPSINRRAAIAMRNAALAGRPVTTPVAVRTLAAAARGFLANPKAVERALARNALVRLRSAPLRPGTAVFRPRPLPLRGPDGRFVSPAAGSSRPSRYGPVRPFAGVR